MRKLRDEGTTIVLTTHYLEEAEELADRVAVIDRGRLIAVDKPDVLLRAARQEAGALPPRRAAGGAAAPTSCARSAPRSTTTRTTVSCPLPKATPADVLAAVAALPGRVVDMRTEQPSLEQVFLALTAAQGGGMNRIGFKTLLVKETRRFLKVPGQTVAQPVITTALYFLVFGFALGGMVREVDGVRYVRFIVPGLVMLSLIQNAFLNTASSMFIAKMQGTIVDLLVAPLSPGELLGAFTLAAVIRGVLVGGIVWLVAAIFTGFSIAHPGWVIAFALLVAAEFALFGLLVAIWSDKFEQLNLIPTFVITPLTFLGGVFYSARMLPAAVERHHAAQSDPLHGRGAALRHARPLRRVAVARHRPHAALTLASGAAGVGHAR